MALDADAMHLLKIRIRTILVTSLIVGIGALMLMIFVPVIVFRVEPLYPFYAFSLFAWSMIVQFGIMNVVAHDLLARKVKKIN